MLDNILIQIQCEYYLRQWLCTQRNCWMCEKFLQLRKVVDAHFVTCVQNVSCANDLRDLFTTHSTPSFSLISNNDTLAGSWSCNTKRLSSAFSSLPPFLSRSILISRPVSRKLNHCAIDENDGSLCHKFMRRKILTIRPRHIEIV